MPGQTTSALETETLSCRISSVCILCRVMYTLPINCEKNMGIMGATAQTLPEVDVVRIRLMGSVRVNTIS